jgi:hypothetical protein
MKPTRHFGTHREQRTNHDGQTQQNQDQEVLSADFSLPPELASEDFVSADLLSRVFLEGVAELPDLFA